MPISQFIARRLPELPLRFAAGAKDDAIADLGRALELLQHALAQDLPSGRLEREAGAKNRGSLFVGKSHRSCHDHAPEYGARGAGVGVLLQISVGLRASSGRAISGEALFVPRKPSVGKAARPFSGFSSL